MSDQTQTTGWQAAYANAAQRNMPHETAVLFANQNGSTWPNLNPGGLPEAWDALLGSAPDATGALSSEAFVRQLRDEWPDPGETCA